MHTAPGGCACAICVQGSDPRARAQGFEAADYVLGGYWVWGRLIENLADVGYDPSTMHMARLPCAPGLSLLHLVAVGVVVVASCYSSHNHYHAEFSSTSRSG